MAEFYNPYTFVWTPPRDQGSDGWDDHARASDSLLYGSLTVEFEAVSPILILDAGTREAAGKVNGHWIYNVVHDPRKGSFPWLPPSSLKGALRSAYETVTNSRFGVFEGKNPLGYRRPINQAANLVPARIEVESQGVNTPKTQIELLFGVNKPTSIGAKKDQTNQGISPLPAAFVGTELLCKLLKELGLPENQYARLHGMEIQADLNLYTHGNFVGYRVTKLTTFQNGKKVALQASMKAGGKWNKIPETKDGPLSEIKGQAGYLLVTGKDAARGKHEERFCFAKAKDNRDIIEDESTVEVLLASYRAVMASYLSAHGLAPHQPAEGIPLRGVSWALHMSDPSRRTLKRGDMVWCALDKKGNPRVLLPVSSSRDLYSNAPRELLDSTLHPAKGVDELSPADRLFGWSAEASGGAMKGCLEIRNIEHSCGSDDCNHIGTSGDRPIALPTLGTPKPQYGRFYVGEKVGQPLPSKTKRVDWFNARGDTEQGLVEQRIRGRKTYWHHVRSPNNDTNSQDILEKWLVDGLGAVPTGQNRSVREWIVPGALFRVEFRVKGARGADIRALVELLLSAHENDVDPTTISIGYAKPLGMGAMRVKDLSVNLESDCKVRERLRRMESATSESVGLKLMNDWEDYIKGKFDRIGNSIEPKSFEQWKIVSRGVDADSVRYPYSEDENAEGFSWFINNERSNPQVLPAPNSDVNEGGLSTNSGGTSKQLSGRNSHGSNGFKSGAGMGNDGEKRNGSNSRRGGRKRPPNSSREK